MTGPESAGAEVRIRESTYPEYADRAVDLYQRLDRGRGLYDEAIDFGITGIDVGSRDGRYLGVMRELGMSDVTPIDSVGYEMLQGVRAGIVDPEKHYIGTLQEWLAAGNEPVDTAFVLNMFHRSAQDASFISAIAESVKPGGLVVASFGQRQTSRNFTHTIATNAIPLRVLYANPDLYAEANIGPGPEGWSSSFLMLLRREGDG